MNFIQYVNFTARDESQKYQDLPSRTFVRDLTQNLRAETTQAPSSIAKDVKQALQQDAAKRVTIGGQNI